MCGIRPCTAFHQGVPNNYETDLIFPIVQRAASLAGVDYHKADATTKTALKVCGVTRNLGLQRRVLEDIDSSHAKCFNSSCAHLSFKPGHR